MSIGGKPILILGAAGKLGTLLRGVWPEAAHVKLHSRRPQVGHISFDILGEPDALSAAVADARAVICLAGATDARTDIPARANYDVAAAVIRAAANTTRPPVFLASSAAVYGRQSGVLTEETPCRPISDYGRAKLTMEEQSRALSCYLGVSVTSLRIGNIAGADAILGGWREGFYLDQFADATTPRRSYIGPCSLAQVLVELADMRDLPDVVNVAAPGAIQMSELLNAAGLPWVPRDAPTSAIAQVVLATERLSRHIPIDPAQGLPDTLVRQWRLATQKQTL